MHHDEANEAAHAGVEVTGAAVNAGPPDRPEARFLSYGDPATRLAVMGEYNRTLRMYRDTGVVDARQREDYTDGDGGLGRGLSVYLANRDAVDEIRRWQAGTWTPEEPEEEEWEDAELHHEDDVRETEEASGISGHRADSETDSTGPRAISEEDFAQARERLDRLKLRLARIERGEPPAEIPPTADSAAADERGLIRGVRIDLGQRSRLHSYHPTVPQLDIARAPAELPADIDTEPLLNALIGECHFLMREVAFRSMCQSAVLEDRMDWVKAAMNLATTGAKVAKSVARLRHGPAVKETRHAMIIENKVAAVVQGGGGA